MTVHLRVESGGYFSRANLVEYLRDRIQTRTNDLARTLLAERESDTIRGNIEELKKLLKQIEHPDGDAA